MPDSSHRTSTQTADRPPTRSAEHHHLEAFVGRWRLEGRNGEGAPLAAGARVTGEERYDWLPGEFFLVTRWARYMGDADHRGIGVIGRDVTTGEFTVHSFDNLGYSRTYHADVQRGKITFTGKWERATMSVSDDGRTTTAHWEITTDGSTWLPLCDLEGTRLE